MLNSLSSYTLPTQNFDLRNWFGSKGANLIILRNNIGRLNREYPSAKFTIEPFCNVDASVFRSWIAGNQIELREHYQWMRKFSAYCNSVLVRSDALFGEGSEICSGAGIYESLLLSTDATYEEFLATVKAVFVSTTAEHAKNYRREFGITEEIMSVIIQCYRDPEDVDFSVNYGFIQYGTVFTHALGTPELMELCLKDNQRVLVYRNLLLQQLNNPYLGFDDGVKYFHFIPELDRLENSLFDLLAICQKSLILSNFWDRSPVKIEYQTNGQEFSVFQLDELPPQILKLEGSSIGVSFPEQTPLWEGRSVGKEDKLLTVLHPDQDTDVEDGLVVFLRSYQASLYNNRWILNCFPKSGAILLLNSSLAFCAHIESLGYERGLVCLFPNRIFGTVAEMSLASEFQRMSLVPSCEHPLFAYDKVRVISNGVTGRIYQV
jgi:hypothetical protein